MPEEATADTKATKNEPKAQEPKAIPKPPTAPNPLGVHDVNRIPVPEWAAPKESPLPEARAEVSRTAYDRQLPENRLPASRKRRFKVSFGDNDPMTVVADNENEAWAVYCDARREWPSPRLAGRQVEDLGPVPVQE